MEVDLHSEEKSPARRRKRKKTKVKEVEGDESGFTILSAPKKKARPLVQRTLPKWLAEPDVLSRDISAHQQPITLLEHVLHPSIKSTLEKLQITHFFPVQVSLIPAVLQGVQQRTQGFPPPDICCSAPTGSGKTLAYVLPLVQAMCGSMERHLRALIVVPTRDLALQVYQVLMDLVQPLNLKAALLVGQQSLLRERVTLFDPDGNNLVDVAVATPGRLLDHILQGLDLTHLSWLVLDEADRLMDSVDLDWMSRLDDVIRPTHPPTPTVHRVRSGMTEHWVQKLLFSATLSRNAEQLDQLNLFEPRLFTASAQPGDQTTPEHCVVPSELTEYYVTCEEMDKPLLLTHLLLKLNYRRVLCFTNTLESTKRLALLLRMYNKLNCAQYSAALPAPKRKSVLSSFAEGKIDVLVCSDAAARGLDLTTVMCVVSYDAPLQTTTYFHRVGRTARAGKSGTAITFVRPHEVAGLKKVTSRAQELQVSEEELDYYREDLEEALHKMGKLLNKQKS